MFSASSKSLFDICDRRILSIPDYERLNPETFCTSIEFSKYMFKNFVSFIQRKRLCNILCIVKQTQLSIRIGLSLLTHRVNS